MFWAVETEEQMVAETKRRPLQTVLKKRAKMLFKPPVLTEKERNKAKSYYNLSLK